LELNSAGSGPRGPGLRRPLMCILYILC